MRLFLLMLVLCFTTRQLIAQISFDSEDASVLKDLNWNNKPSHDIYKDWNNHVLNPYPGIQSYLGDTITLKLISDSSCSFSKPCAGQITSGFGWRSGSAIDRPAASSPPRNARRCDNWPSHRPRRACRRAG